MEIDTRNVAVARLFASLIVVPTLVKIPHPHQNTYQNPPKILPNPFHLSYIHSNSYDDLSISAAKDYNLTID